MIKETIKPRREKREREDKGTTANKITATLLIFAGALAYVLRGDVPLMAYFGILAIPFILAKRNLTMF